MHSWFQVRGADAVAQVLHNGHKQRMVAGLGKLGSDNTCGDGWVRKGWPSQSHPTQHKYYSPPNATTLCSLHCSHELLTYFSKLSFNVHILIGFTRNDS